MRAAATFALSISLGFAASAQAAGFDVVVLGARGGIEDGNLSSYLISPQGDPRGVTCDVGALVNGLRAADAKGAFDHVEVPADSEFTRIGYMLTENIKGYLVSHAHMDHIAGLIAASPDDSKKPIYALPSVNADISSTYFNWDAWPNFGDRGKEPQLKKYAMQDLTAAAKTELSGTAMSVTAYPLAHSGVESTAFLIESGDDAVLCFGDTGPDEIEKSTAMADIWTAVADKVRDKKLKAVIVEVSYVNSQPDKFLFGHLTPAWLLKSLRDLEGKAGKGSLKDMPIVISHIKYSLKKASLPQDDILKELLADNDIGAKFLIPEQGMKWSF
ncbi:MAG: 3',5'-cyclic-nucleotide phosphodiesterase [Mesorhizobium sp.]